MRAPLTASTLPAASAAPGLPDEVARTLDRVARVLPVEAAAARARWGDVLGPVLASRWTAVAGRFSVLTSTGLPVEMAWSSRDPGLRMTCEVAPPEVAHRDRLVLAADLAGIDDLGPWVDAQSAGPLRYGAWLGLRHRGAQAAAKVYVELPAGASPPARWDDAVGPLRRLVDGLTWRMAGLGDDGTVELYARAPRLADEDLADVERALVGTGALADAVHRVLRAPGLPRPSGLSVVLDRAGGPRAVTWFGFANAVWRDDAATAAALRAWAADPTTRRVLDALEGRHPAGAERRRHAMVGVAVDRSGATAVGVGLRPA